MRNEEKHFVCGNDAVAMGTRLARPHVIAAYPITPQTIAVERLSDFVEDGSLKSEFLHVESEHSALCLYGCQLNWCENFYSYFITGFVIHG